MTDTKNVQSNGFISEQLQEFVAAGQLPPLDQAIVAEPPSDWPEKVRQALDELTPEERELLGLFQDLSCKQIAERKRQSVESIRERIGELYAELRAKID